MVDPAPASRRRRLLGPPALALAAWATWLGWLGMMAAMLAAGPWHPHFLPVTAVFGLFLAASLTVLVVGSWRIARGPGRLRAATWLLLGVAPALIATGHFLYGLRLNSSRLIVLDLPIKLLIPFGESIMDLEARFRYPERTEGETVVMIAASGRFPPRRSRRRPCSTARSSSRRRRTCPGRIRGPSPTGIQRRWRRGSRRSSPG